MAIVSGMRRGRPAACRFRAASVRRTVDIRRSYRERLAHNPPSACRVLDGEKEAKLIAAAVPSPRAAYVGTLSGMGDYPYRPADASFDDCLNLIDANLPGMQSGFLAPFLSHRPIFLKRLP